MTAGAFDTALLGQSCWLEFPTGKRIELPVHRWRDDPGEPEELLLDRCTGPTLDIGCGPGRLTAALGSRGVPALGVDSSVTAIRLTRSRGAAAVRRDVFDRLPGEGRWAHVLLADGNIGIGGDPITLLRRTATLVRPGGSALVELDPPGTGLATGRVRVRDGATPGAWFPWAWLGADAVAGAAAEAGMAMRWSASSGARWFAELVATS